MPVKELVDRRLLALLHALDPAYGPKVRGQVTVPGLGDFNKRYGEYRAFMGSFQPALALTAAGWEDPASHNKNHRQITGRVIQLAVNPGSR